MVVTLADVANDALYFFNGGGGILLNMESIPQYIRHQE